MTLDAKNITELRSLLSEKFAIQCSDAEATQTGIAILRIMALKIINNKQTKV